MFQNEVNILGVKKGGETAFIFVTAQFQVYLVGKFLLLQYLTVTDLFCITCGNITTVLYALPETSFCS
jgi:hypothetical protein